MAHEGSLHLLLLCASMTQQKNCTYSSYWSQTLLTCSPQCSWHNVNAWGEGIGCLAIHIYREGRKTRYNFFIFFFSHIVMCLTRAAATMYFSFARTLCLDQDPLLNKWVPELESLWSRIIMFTSTSAFSTGGQG